MQFIWPLEYLNAYLANTVHDEHLSSYIRTGRLVVIEFKTNYFYKDGIQCKSFGFLLFKIKFQNKVNFNKLDLD